MKKIIFMAMLLPTMLFAQEEKASENKSVEKYTLSGNINFSNPTTLGFSFERNAELKNKSYILNISAAGVTADIGGKNYTGNGFAIESGVRQYYNDNSDKWYFENLLSYGDVKFKETISGVGTYEATYSYFSLFNSNFGYKWNVGKFSIDPSIGYNWKWEIKNDNFENRDVENFVFKAGVKVGYRF